MGEMARYNEQLHRANVAANIANMHQQKLLEEQQQQVQQQQQQVEATDEVDQDLEPQQQLVDPLNFGIDGAIKTEEGAQASGYDLNTYQHHQYKEEDQFQM